MNDQLRRKFLTALTGIACSLALAPGVVVLGSDSARAQKDGSIGQQDNLSRGGFVKRGNGRGAYRQGGYNQGGYNQGGYSQGINNGINQGINGQGGYNRPGFNRGGYNQGGYNPGRAAGTRNAKRINKIINGLTPHGRSHNRSKRYRRNIRKIVRWRKGHGNVGTPIYVNYNRSVDLSVYFEFNSVTILPAARPVLDDLGYALNSPNLRFARYLIAGHTDSRGASGYNQWLSDERARAVADYLIYNFNIAPQRLVSAGFGEESPVNRRRPAAAINRRVEVSLIENNYSFAPGKTIQLRKYNFTPQR